MGVEDNGLWRQIGVWKNGKPIDTHTRYYYVGDKTLWSENGKINKEGDWENIYCGNAEYRDIDFNDFSDNSKFWHTPNWRVEVGDSGCIANTCWAE